MMRFTAILLKEFRILLRSGRAYWILMALLTLAGGAFYLMWQEGAGAVPFLIVADWASRRFKSCPRFNSASLA